jgi:hypothetical protein
LILLKAAFSSWTLGDSTVKRREQKMLNYKEDIYFICNFSVNLQKGGCEIMKASQPIIYDKKKDKCGAI